MSDRKEVELHPRFISDGTGMIKVKSGSTPIREEDLPDVVTPEDEASRKELGRQIYKQTSGVDPSF